MPYVFVVLMCIFAGILAAVRQRAGLAHHLFFKSAASVMFVLVAVSARMGADQTYYLMILIGLCMSLAGDVLLVFTDIGDRYFLAGMAFFLLAHVFYIIGFFLFVPFSLFDVAFFIMFLTIGASAFYAQKLNLGQLKLPIFIYTIVLCAMAAKALTMLFIKDGIYSFAICAAVGGVMFAFSDLALAYGQFGEKATGVFRTINTVLYYGGQALIALSVMI